MGGGWHRNTRYLTPTESFPIDRAGPNGEDAWVIMAPAIRESDEVGEEFIQVHATCLTGENQLE